MLSTQEISRLTNRIAENPRMSAKQLMLILREEFMGNDSPKIAPIRANDGLNKVFPEGLPPTDDLTAKRERERGFKIQTKERSERGEPNRRPSM